MFIFRFNSISDTISTTLVNGYSLTGYIQDFSDKIQIPIPATCPVLSYTSEGSVCVDMDCLVTEDEVFLKTVDDEGFFEAEPQKQNIIKPPELHKGIPDCKTDP